MAKNRVTGLIGLLSGFVLGTSVLGSAYFGRNVYRLNEPYKEVNIISYNFLFFKEGGTYGFEKLSLLEDEIKSRQKDAVFGLWKRASLGYAKSCFLSVDEESLRSLAYCMLHIKESSFSSYDKETIERTEGEIFNHYMDLMNYPFSYEKRPRINISEPEIYERIEKIARIELKLEKEIEKKFGEVSELKKEYDFEEDKLQKKNYAGFLISLLAAAEAGLVSLYLVLRKK